MTKSIYIGARGRIVVYFDGKDVRVKNETSCHLIVDNKMLAPGETV